MEESEQRIYLATQNKDYPSILHIGLLFVYLPRIPILCVKLAGAWTGRRIY
jgi:hypothetical protein